jgi:hypothetical protein
MATKQTKCPAEYTLAMIGGRWKIPLIFHLQAGARRFSELSNETAGEHFTPREVIRLMVDLLFIEDDDALRTPGIVRTMLDPACGTGGMLSVAADYLPSEPRGEARGLRPGAERRDLRDLPVRHDAQGPEGVEHPPRQQLQRGRLPGRSLRLPLANRRSASSGRRSSARSRTSTTSSASGAASGPACPASTTARSSSSST